MLRHAFTCKNGVAARGGLGLVKNKADRRDIRTTGLVSKDGRSTADHWVYNWNPKNERANARPFAVQNEKKPKKTTRTSSVRSYAVPEYHCTHNVTTYDININLLYNTPVFVGTTHPWLDRVVAGGRAHDYRKKNRANTRSFTGLTQQNEKKNVWVLAYSHPSVAWTCRRAGLGRSLKRKAKLQ